MFLAAAGDSGHAGARDGHGGRRSWRVEAAKAGGMAAIGIARADDADLLAKAGADIVVTTLDEVDLAAVGRGRLERKAS